jgi:hypothetical protein
MGFLRRSGKRAESGDTAGGLTNPSPPGDDGRPVLAVDVDGVISLFGFEGQPDTEAGRFHLIDGMPHLISHTAGACLRRLLPSFELIWATGWEEKANDYLPNLLGLPELPTLHFGPDARFGTAHWKLGPIGEYASGRPLAWIDDSLNDACREWAAERSEPTLLVETESMFGIGDEHVETLLRWAESVPGYTRP